MTTERMVYEALKDLGTPCNIIGYHYLKDAIVTVVESPEMLRAVTKALYPSIALKYGIKTSQVERDMRHAVIRTFKMSDRRHWQKYFGDSVGVGSGKPTNSQFIAAIAEYIRMEKKEA